MKEEAGDPMEDEAAAKLMDSPLFEKMAAKYGDRLLAAIDSGNDAECRLVLGEGYAELPWFMKGLLKEEELWKTFLDRKTTIREALKARRSSKAQEA